MFLQGSLEDNLVRRRGREQGHGRVELQIVRKAEDFARGASLHGIHKLCALPQPRTENSMRQIRFGFRKPRDCESFRHRAAPQTLNLRKNKPHPVALLAAPSQFRTHALKDRILRFDKAS
jgi:hypothetical protein